MSDEKNRLERLRSELAHHLKGKHLGPDSKDAQYVAAVQGLILELGCVTDQLKPPKTREQLAQRFTRLATDIAGMDLGPRALLMIETLVLCKQRVLDIHDGPAIPGEVTRQPWEVYQHTGVSSNADKK